MKPRLDQVRVRLRGIAAQRHRALRVAVLSFLAGLLLHVDRTGHVGNLPIPLFTGLLYMAFVTPAAVATALLLPGLTALSDAVQWARLAFAAAVAAFPAVLRPVADQPLLGATVVILGGMAIVATRQRQRRPVTATA
ncbi:hypothetical protein [Tabrizicola sp. YIM 78059]|uniref:hypothetical protein n=1 Tax=Tabrizicola sp. YIM 78059 TaxID=2529861 RepID=UPI0010AA6335|nr:hypothetical protein [Tabrizicola sp. YIM 78059]